MKTSIIKNICATAMVGLALLGGSVSAATTLQVPTPTASKGTYTSYVRVSWSKVTGASGYIIKRGTTSTYAYATQLKKVSGVNTLALNDTSAVAGKTYYYWVCPYNSRGSYWYNTQRYASGYRSSIVTETLSLSSTSVTAGTKVYIYYKSGNTYKIPSSLSYNASSGCATVYKYSSLSGNACGYITTSKAGSVTVYAGLKSATLTIKGESTPQPEPVYYTYSIQGSSSVNVGNTISLQCYRSDGTLVDATWSIYSGGSYVSIAKSTNLGHAIACKGLSAGTATIKAYCNGYTCYKTITVTGDTSGYISGASSLRYGNYGYYYLYVGGKKITASSVAWSRSGLATMQDKGYYGLLKATSRPVSTNKVTIYAVYNGTRYSKTVTITR